MRQSPGPRRCPCTVGCTAAAKRSVKTNVETTGQAAAAADIAIEINASRGQIGEGATESAGCAGRPAGVAESLARLPWSMPDAVPLRRSRRWLIAAASVLLAGLAFGIWYLSHRSGESGTAPAPIAVAPPPVAKGPPKPAKSCRWLATQPVRRLGTAESDRGNQIAGSAAYVRRTRSARPSRVARRRGRFARHEAAVAPACAGSRCIKKRMAIGASIILACGRLQRPMQRRRGQLRRCRDGLSLLPFLGAGQSHKLGMYQGAVGAD